MVKYDAEIQPEADNTSHGLVVDLVGTDKDVLDVGCSTGYLGRALRERGCTVTGIEIDPVAAEAAKAYLIDVHIADLDQVDLASIPLGRDFDVIVFADVLEHLKDPVRTLRSSVAHLRPGGYVVISIPNVAHGSVRLSLLSGHFDYRELGLLDDTHIRFFTRTTLRALLDASGFAEVDMRRTTAGVFATEIQVDATAVPDAVHRDLELDADAETYQFVFTAVPLTGEVARFGALLREKDDALAALRRQLTEIIREADLGDVAPSVGVLSTSSSSADVLRQQVLRSELGRRLDGFSFRPLSPADLARLTGSDGSDAPPFHVDAVVVTGRLEAAAAKMLGRLESVGIKVFFLGAVPDAGAELGAGRGPLIAAPSMGTLDAGGRESVPDPAIVADRVYDGELLHQRAQLLRLLGHLPVDGGVLLAALREVPAGTATAGLRNVAEVATAQGLGLVVVDLPPEQVVDGSRWSVPGAEPLDVAAAVQAAALVVADDPVVLAIALALGRPAVGLSSASSGPVADLAAWLGDADLWVPRLSAVDAALAMARARAADVDARTGLQAMLDEPFDRLAAALVEAATRRAPATVAARLRELQDECNVLRVVNSGLVQRQRAERIAFGQQAAARLALDDAPGDATLDARTWGELEGLRAEVDRLRIESDQARRELAALLATRTFRTLRPAREVYRRLRSLAR